MPTRLAGRFVEETPDALVAISVTGVVEYWNRAAEVIFGYASDEAVGKALNDLIVPPDRFDEERRHREEAIENGLAVWESVRRRKDGTLVQVSVSTRAVRGPGGTVEYLLSSKRDVSRLTILRESNAIEARFGVLLESLPDALVMVNVTGRVVMVNSQAERMFGRTRAEILGEPVEVLLPSRFRGAHHAHRAGYFAQPHTRAMGAGLELFGLRKDGSEFPVEVSLSPLETTEGLLVSSAIRDVSDRKRIEQELREKNLELEKAASVKDRFFASVSHELRTPLNAILGFTGTLLMKLPGPLNPEQEKQLGFVQRGARHLLALINDLLDLSKFEAQEHQLTLEDLDSNRVVEEVAATLRPEAERRGLNLSVRFAQGGAPLRTDRRALRQILINLLGNAIKFTQKGGIVVSLENRGGGPTPQVAITVQDTGRGIPAAEHARIFEPFSRVETSGTDVVEGTGLGLHLSRKLAAALGGLITLESEPGQGSAFTLILPRG